MNSILKKVRIRVRNKGIFSKKSCKKIAQAKTSHGMSETRFYNIWLGIKNRCTRNNIPIYKYYGGRGIKCLWTSFEEFKLDMFDSYQNHAKEFGEKNTSIERTNNNGNYCKENCRWSTRNIQVKNRRNNVQITLNGETHILTEWSHIKRIPRSTLQNRILRGLTPDKILQT